jgi:hypothetical protein
MPGPNLESSESDSHTNLADENLFVGIHNVIYNATNQAFREYHKILEKYEKHQKSDLSVGCKPDSRLPTPTRTVINFSTSQNSES